MSLLWILIFLAFFGYVVSQTDQGSVFWLAAWAKVKAFTLKHYNALFPKK